MKRHVLVCLFINCLYFCYGDAIESFSSDFQKVLSPGVSENEVGEIVSRNVSLLFPSDEADVSKPLVTFRNSDLYVSNINKLFDSEIPFQRMFAYAVAGAVGDSTFESRLIERLVTEKYKSAEVWAGIALINLGTHQTTALFEWLVKNRYFPNTPILSIYLRLDKTALQETAYTGIGSENRDSKVLATQIFAVLRSNPKTETLLKKAIVEWDMDTKGYAIYAAKELKIGDLATILTPLLDDKRTRQISLDALANSPTQSDRALLGSQSPDNSPSIEYLNSLYRSKSEENLRLWLQLIATRSIPDDYVFFVFEQPLLKMKTLLVDLQNAIEREKSLKITAELVRALEGNTDDKSISILINLMSSSDSTVRYWAVATIAAANPPQLRAILPKMLQNSDLRVSNETDLAIKNNINNLQMLFESILSSSPDQDWKRSSVDYLSAFPLPSHRKLFRDFLSDPKEDFFIRQSAAMGLARLGDHGAVDLIVAACDQVNTSPRNAIPYLEALRSLGGSVAKAEIAKFKDSDDSFVREWATKSLDD